MKCHAVFVAAAIVASAGVVRADDYPQWRGPDRTGVSKEKGLLQQWPTGGPKLHWKATGVGKGYSTPSIAKGVIYVIGTTDGNKTESVFALKESDGKLLWSTKLGNVGPNIGQQYPGARSTPTVENDRLYALGSDGDLACLSVAKGDIVWKKSYRKDFGGQPGKWAYAESPLIDGNVLVCSPGGKTATIAALDKKDGKVIWQWSVAAGEMAGYASPIVGEAGGIRQYVQFLDKGVVGLEAKTGKFLWRYDKTVDRLNMNCTTPIFHNGQVLTASFSKGPGLVKLIKQGETLAAQEVYLSSKMPNNHGGIVLIGDHIYGTSGSALLCMEFATGKEVWKSPSVGKGSLSCADGCLYVRGEKGGAVALVEATPTAYKEKGRFTPPGSSVSNVWPHPIVANGCLYLRDHDILFCYDVKAK